MRRIIFIFIYGLFCFVYFKFNKANLKPKTTLLSLCISACGALGVNCFITWYSFAAFGERHLHPVAYPMSITLGIIALIIFVFLAVFYLCIRLKSKSFKLLLMDILTSIICLPVFVSSFSLFVDFLSNSR